MADRRAKKRLNAKGRSNTDRFARLPHRLMHSAAYRALTPNARSLLVELISMENGSNNGSLFLSVRDAADRMGVVDLMAATNAFDQLQELGFIEMTHDAHFKVKAGEHSRARCWRLTWLSGLDRKAPTWDFEQREPLPQSRDRKRMERGQRAIKTFRKARENGRLPVLDSETMMQMMTAGATAPVLDSNTLIAGNDDFQQFPFVRDSTTHIAATIGEEADAKMAGWWQPDWTPTMATMAFLVYLNVALKREFQMTGTRA